MSAADFIHPATSVEYAPLDSQTSIAETQLNAEIPRDNRPTPGAIDFIANGVDDGFSW